MVNVLVLAFSFTNSLASALSRDTDITSAVCCPPGLYYWPILSAYFIIIGLYYWKVTHTVQKEEHKFYDQVSKHLPFMNQTYKLEPCLAITLGIATHSG